MVILVWLGSRKKSGPDSNQTAELGEEGYLLSPLDVFSKQNSQGLQGWMLFNLLWLQLFTHESPWGLVTSEWL